MELGLSDVTTTTALGDARPDAEDDDTVYETIGNSFDSLEVHPETRLPGCDLLDDCVDYSGESLETEFASPARVVVGVDQSPLVWHSVGSTAPVHAGHALSDRCKSYRDYRTPASTAGCHQQTSIKTPALQAPPLPFREVQERAEVILNNGSVNDARQPCEHKEEGRFNEAEDYLVIDDVTEKLMAYSADDVTQSSEASGFIEENSLTYEAYACHSEFVTTATEEPLELGEMYGRFNSQNVDHYTTALGIGSLQPANIISALRASQEDYELSQTDSSLYAWPSLSGKTS